MAMGREGEVQGDLMMTWAEIPRSPGHVFYDRLQKLLAEAGFDAFVEETCKPYYAPRMGAPSLPPGGYFRMHIVGYFEGLDSERGIVWRCADSRSLGDFLRLGKRDKVPDHSWLSKTRSRLPHEVHEKVFALPCPRLQPPEDSKRLTPSRRANRLARASGAWGGTGRGSGRGGRQTPCHDPATP